MTALMDTHTFLWWNTADPQLSPLCRRILADSSNVVYLSVVSAWEIAIKAGTGKLPLPDAPPVYVPSRVAHYGFSVLPVTLGHTLETYNLPPHHRDPFDRLLVAQCRVENLPILTADAQIARYGVTVLW